MADKVELDHDRRFRVAQEFLKSAEREKRNSGAFGEVGVVLKFKDGMIAEVEIFDRTTYR